MVPESLRQTMPSGHPRMLRGASSDDPQELGMLSRRQIGQAFGWALDRSRDPDTGLAWTQLAAATKMGYTDSAVIGRWESGAERVQLDKCLLLGDEFFGEFVCALAQICQGVTVTTQINLRRPS